MLIESLMNFGGVTGLISKLGRLYIGFRGSVWRVDLKWPDFEWEMQMSEVFKLNSGLFSDGCKGLGAAFSMSFEMLENSGLFMYW